MKSPLKRIKIRLSSIEDLFTLIAACTITFIMLLSVSNVIGRYVFNWPVPGAIEIAKVALIIVVFFSMSTVQRTEDHIGMDTFLEILKRKKVSHFHFIQSFHSLIFLVMMGIVGYYFIPDMFASIEMHEWTEGPLYLPIWPFKLCIILGCTLICIRLIVQTIQHFKTALKNDEYETHRTKE